MNLGELIVDLSLDYAEFNQSLEQAKKAASSAAASIEKSFQKLSLSVDIDDKSLTDLNQHINISVQHLKQANTFFRNNPITTYVNDDSLTDLNEHLNVKVRHLKEVNHFYAQNPITVRTNTGQLDELEERLDRLGNRKVTMEVDTIVLNQYQDKTAEVVEQAISNAIRQMQVPQSSGQSAQQSPQSQQNRVQRVQLGLDPLRSIGEGVFENVGKQLSKGVGSSMQDSLGVDMKAFTQIASNSVLRYFGVGKKAQKDPKNNKSKIKSIVEDAIKDYSTAVDKGSGSIRGELDDVDLSSVDAIARNSLLRYFGVGKKAQSDPKNNQAKIKSIIEDAVKQYSGTDVKKENSGVISNTFSEINKAFSETVNKGVQGIAERAKLATIKEVRRASTNVLANSSSGVRDSVNGLFDAAESGKKGSVSQYIGRGLASQSRKAVEGTFSNLFPTVAPIVKEFLATGNKPPVEKQAPKQRPADGLLEAANQLKEAAKAISESAIKVQSVAPVIHEQIADPWGSADLTPVQIPLKPAKQKTKKQEPEPELVLLELPQQTQQHFKTLNAEVGKNTAKSLEFLKATTQENIKQQTTQSIANIKAALAAINQYFKTEYKQVKDAVDNAKSTGHIDDINAARSAAKNYQRRLSGAVKEIDRIVKSGEDAGFSKEFGSELSQVHATGKGQLVASDKRVGQQLGGLNLLEANQFKKDVKTYTELAKKAGIEIDAGLIKGLDIGSAGVTAETRDLLNGLIATVKKTMGIQSPSWVMMGIGAMIAAGLGLGIKNGVVDVSSAVGLLTDAIGDGLKDIQSIPSEGIEAYNQALENAVSDKSELTKKVFEEAKGASKATLPGMVLGTTMMGVANAGLVPKSIETPLRHLGAFYQGKAGVHQMNPQLAREAEIATIFNMMQLAEKGDGYFPDSGFVGMVKHKTLPTLAHTLGGFNYTQNKDKGLQINDVYDWHQDTNTDKNTPFKLPKNLGSKIYKFLESKKWLQDLLGVEENLFGNTKAFTKYNKKTGRELFSVLNTQSGNDFQLGHSVHSELIGGNPYIQTHRLDGKGLDDLTDLATNPYIASKGNFGQFLNHPKIQEYVLGGSQQNQQPSGLLGQLLPALKKDLGSNPILTNLFSSATKAIGKGGSFKDIGTNLITSFGQGILSSDDGVFGILGTFAKSAIGLVKKIFGIASPSKIFHWIGLMLGLGLEEGAMSSLSKANQKITGSVKATTNNAKTIIQGDHSLGLIGNIPLGVKKEVSIGNQVQGADGTVSGSAGYVKNVPYTINDLRNHVGDILSANKNYGTSVVPGLSGILENNLFPTFSKAFKTIKSSPVYTQKNQQKNPQAVYAATPNIHSQPTILNHAQHAFNTLSSIHSQPTRLNAPQQSQATVLPPTNTILQPLQSNTLRQSANTVLQPTNTILQPLQSNTLRQSANTVLQPNWMFHNPTSPQTVSAAIPLQQITQLGTELGNNVISAVGNSIKQTRGLSYPTLGQYMRNAVVAAGTAMSGSLMGMLGGHLKTLFPMIMKVALPMAGVAALKLGDGITGNLLKNGIFKQGGFLTELLSAFSGIKLGSMGGAGIKSAITGITQFLGVFPMLSPLARIGSMAANAGVVAHDVFSGGNGGRKSVNTVLENKTTENLKEAGLNSTGNSTADLVENLAETTVGALFRMIGFDGVKASAVQALIKGKVKQHSEQIANAVGGVGNGQISALIDGYVKGDSTQLAGTAESMLKNMGITGLDPKQIKLAANAITATLSGLHAKFGQEGFGLGESINKGFRKSLANLANAKDDLEYNLKKAVGKASAGDVIGNIFKRMSRGFVVDKGMFDEMWNQVGASFKKGAFKGMSGNEQEGMFGNMMGLMASATAMFAPITAMAASLAPLFLPLMPIIAGIGGAIRMVMPQLSKLFEGMQRVETLQRRFTFLGGSKAGGIAELNYAKGVANQMNVPSEVAANSYSQLAIASKGTKMEGQGVKDLFEGITASLSALGISGQDASLVFMAYTQIMAKGKLSMEELRQQLGEKFPPAMGVFAKAMGVSVAEMNDLVASGSILSQDILPKVAKVLKLDYGKSASGSADSLVLALTKLGNVGFEITSIFTDKLSGALAGIVNFASNGLGFLKDSLGTLIPLGQSFVIGFTATIAVGLTVMMTKIKPVVVLLGTLQSLVLSTFSAIASNLMPMIIGITSDVADGWLGAESDLMQNMTRGFTNMFTGLFSAIDSGVRAMSGKPLFAEGLIGGKGVNLIVAGIDAIKGALGAVFSIIPPGVVELGALVFMLEQAIALGSMALGPALVGGGKALLGMVVGIKNAFIGTVGTVKIWGELMMTSMNAGAVATEKAAARAMIANQGWKMSLIALRSMATHVAIAMGILMFSKGDFSNPLGDKIGETSKKVTVNLNNMKSAALSLGEAFDKAAGQLVNLNNKLTDTLPSKGVQLDIRNFWDKTKSTTSDDLIRNSNRAEVERRQREKDGKQTFGDKALNVADKALKYSGITTPMYLYNSWLSDRLVPKTDDATIDLVKKYGLEKYIAPDKNLRVDMAQSQVIKALQDSEANTKALASTYSKLGLTKQTQQNYLIPEKMGPVGNTFDIDAQIKAANDKIARLNELDKKYTFYQSSRADGRISKEEDLSGFSFGGKTANPERIIRGDLDIEKNIIREQIKQLENQRASTAQGVERFKSNKEIQLIDAQILARVKRGVQLEKANPSDATRKELGGIDTAVLELKTRREKIINGMGSDVKDAKETLDILEQHKKDILDGADEATKSFNIQIRRAIAKNIDQQIELAKNAFDIAQKSVPAQFGDDLYTNAANKLRDTQIAFDRTSNADKIASATFRASVNSSSERSANVAPILANRQVADLEKQQKELDNLTSRKKETIDAYAAILRYGANKDVKDELEKLKAEVLKDDESLAQLQDDVATAKRGIRQTLVDQTKQVADYYRTAVREAQAVSIEFQKAQKTLENSRMQNKLREALIGAGDNIYTQFIEGIINIISQTTEIEKQQLEARKQRIDYENNIEDIRLQAAELQRSLPGKIIPLDSSMADNFNLSLEEINGTVGTINGSVKDVANTLSNDVVEAAKKANAELDKLNGTFKNLQSVTDNWIDGFGNKITDTLSKLNLTVGVNTKPINSPVWAANAMNVLKDIPVNTNTNSNIQNQIAKGKVRFVENSRSSMDSRGGHIGDDIVAPIGSKIFSPLAGTVVQSRVGGTKNTDDANPLVPGYQPQQLVIIKLDMPIEFEGKKITHLNMRHLLDRNVQVGQKVKMGDLLGTVGEAGGRGTQFGTRNPGTARDADAAHLHIEYAPSENNQRNSLPDSQASRLTAKLSKEYSGGVQNTVNTPKTSRNRQPVPKVPPIPGLDPRIDTKFLQTVANIAQSVGAKPEDLLKTMLYETGGTLSPSARNSRTSATGLIQFMPATARGLGTNINALAQMSPQDQLVFVQKYLKQNSRGQKLDSFRKVLSTVFAGNPNASLGIGDGDITLGNYLKKAESRYGNTARQLTQIAMQGGAIDPNSMQQAVTQAGRLKLNTAAQQLQTNQINSNLTPEQIEENALRQRLEAYRFIRSTRKSALGDISSTKDSTLGTQRTVLEGLSPNMSNADRFGIQLADLRRKIEKDMEALQQIIDDTDGAIAQKPDLQAAFNLAMKKFPNDPKLAADAVKTNDLTFKATAFRNAEAKKDLAFLKSNADDILKASIADFDKKEFFRLSEQDIAQQTKVIEQLQQQLQSIQKLEEIDPLNPLVLKIPSLQKNIDLLSLNRDQYQQLLDLQKRYYDGGGKGGNMSEEAYQKEFKAILNVNSVKKEGINLNFNYANTVKKIEQATKELTKAQTIQESRADAIKIRSDRFSLQNKETGFVNIQGIKDQFALDSESSDIAFKKLVLENTGNFSLKPQERLLKTLRDYRNFVERQNLSIAENVNAIKDGELKNQQIIINKAFAEREAGLKYESRSSNIENLKSDYANPFYVNSLKRKLEGEKLKLEYDKSLTELNNRLETESLGGIVRPEGYAESLRTDLLDNYLEKVKQVNRESKDFNSTIKDIAQQQLTSLSSGLTDVIMGTKSLGDVLSSLADSVLSGVLNTVLNSVISGKGGIGGLFNFNKGGKVPNYADGGVIGAIGDALQMERQASGVKPVLAALTPGERVLTVRQNKRFEELQMERVLNYAGGGVVGGSVPNMNFTAPSQSSTVNVNVPVNVNGGQGDTSVNVPQLQNAVRSAVLSEIQKQQRPGGALNK
jgi:tape measure domain-containing protein